MAIYVFLMILCFTVHEKQMKVAVFRSPTDHRDSPKFVRCEALGI